MIGRVSPILNSYNGRVIGNEIMPALDHVARLGSTLSNPYYDAYPQPAKYQNDGEYALPAGMHSVFEV